MEVASAYETVAWQSLFWSQDAGMGRVPVRVLHMGEEHGVGE